MLASAVATRKARELFQIFPPRAFRKIHVSDLENLALGSLRGPPTGCVFRITRQGKGPGRETKEVIMNATTAITSKAHAAVRRYLEIKGYAVVEDGWAHGQDAVDFIARDGDALVFITTQVRDNVGEGIPEIARDRKAFERIAAAYLTDADITDCAVRLDTVSLLVIGNDRALLKHHINALGEVG